MQWPGWPWIMLFLYSRERVTRSYLICIAICGGTSKNRSRDAVDQKGIKLIIRFPAAGDIYEHVPLLMCMPDR
jgi:hypothetical protein